MNKVSMIVTSQQRYFAKKKKASDDEATVTEEEVEAFEAEAEPEVVAEAAPVYTAPATPEPTPVSVSGDFSAATRAAEPEKVDSSLYTAFTTGDVKVIQSTPDNKAPSSEDTIEGRYAGVLFTTASQQEALFTIYEDMTYLLGLYNASESFKMFTQNGGVGVREITKFNAALNELGDFHPLTIKFLEVLADNKRLTYINVISKKYAKLYQ